MVSTIDIALFSYDTGTFGLFMISVHSGNSRDFGHKCLDIKIVPFYV